MPFAAARRFFDIDYFHFDASAPILLMAPLMLFTSLDAAMLMMFTLIRYDAAMLMSPPFFDADTRCCLILLILPVDFDARLIV